jgi:hypothetical protein
MALTKVEAAKLSNDLLLRGVIETIVKESMLLQMLPFMEVTGTEVTNPTTQDGARPRGRGQNRGRPDASG